MRGIHGMGEDERVAASWDRGVCYACLHTAVVPRGLRNN